MYVDVINPKSPPQQNTYTIKKKCRKRILKKDFSNQYYILILLQATSKIERKRWHHFIAF